jgi:hypothetical protein
MSYDPNWFYSSLAQCAAAVVGLLGAVLATRLQEQYVNVRASHEEVSKLIRQFREQVCSQINHIDSYATFADDRIREIENALDLQQTQLLVTREISFWGSNSSGSGWSIDINKEILSNYQKYRSLVNPTLSLLALHTEPQNVKDVATVEKTLVELRKILPNECFNLIESLQNIDIAVSNANVYHRRIASVRIIATVAAIQAWLCIFGLVVPLAYLSAYAATSKIILLAAFALGIVAIPGYIGFELARIFQMRNVDINRKTY